MNANITKKIDGGSLFIAGGDGMSLTNGDENGGRTRAQKNQCHLERIGYSAGYASSLTKYISSRSMMNERGEIGKRKWHCGLNHEQ